MSGKKTPPTTQGTSLPTLKIGSRVRCSDDGVAGRIVWANGVSVKIKWDDGKQVTWQRAELAGKSIQILEAAGENGQPEKPPAVTEPIDQAAVPEAAEQPVVEQSLATEVGPTELPPTPEPTPTELPAVEQTTTAQAETPVPAKAKKTRTRKAEQGTSDGQEKKLSCLDAAAKVMAETGQPMTCQQMIEVMAKMGYWTSPDGQTPAATLYSAILRELKAKGADARFVKTERGKFGPKA